MYNIKLDLVRWICDKFQFDKQTVSIIANTIRTQNGRRLGRSEFRAGYNLARADIMAAFLTNASCQRSGLRGESNASKFGYRWRGPKRCECQLQGRNGNPGQISPGSTVGPNHGHLRWPWLLKRLPVSGCLNYRSHKAAHKASEGLQQSAIDCSGRRPRTRNAYWLSAVR